jgi:23S rRNA (cytidine1920-2'-O)/16S rRNA (cytidine1409-2'-O)-methyltransferase
VKVKCSVKHFLVNSGLANTELEAEKLVLSRRVLVNDKLVEFAGQEIKPEDKVSLVADKKYISRAGEKLDFALKTFELELADCVCADVGSSTGGFCGVLLERAVKKIYAIDVARGEIAWKLRTDPRIVLMEKTNARELLSLPEPIDFVSIDVSFISTSMILPNVRKWIKDNAKVVVLVKPQFEAERELIPRGGVIIDPEVHKIVLEKFAENVRKNGFVFNGLCASPILGAEGNKEFLALLSLEGEEIGEESLCAAI